MSESPLLTLWKDLRDEVDLVEKLYAEDKSPARARLLIRTAFAGIQCLCAVTMNAAQFNLVAKVSAEMTCGLIGRTMEEDFFTITALSEQQFEIVDNGEVKRKAMRINFIRQMLFALKTLAKLNGYEVDLKGVPGWESLQQAIKVRDRITHPKSHEDFFVTEDEVKHTEAALKWFVECVHRVSKKGKAKAASKTKKPPVSERLTQIIAFLILSAQFA